MGIAENVRAVRERIEDIAGGRRIWLVAASKMNGAEAVRLGLIDALGTLSDALDYLHRER